MRLTGDPSTGQLAGSAAAGGLRGRRGVRRAPGAGAAQPRPGARAARARRPRLRRVARRPRPPRLIRAAPAPAPPRARAPTARPPPPRDPLTPFHLILFCHYNYLLVGILVRMRWDLVWGAPHRTYVNCIQRRVALMEIRKEVTALDRNYCRFPCLR